MTHKIRSVRVSESKVRQDTPRMTLEFMGSTTVNVSRVDELPMYHRPFDRLLIAQCLAEGHTLVTQDGDMARYDVPILSV